jgi:hypothetical protein
MLSQLAVSKRKNIKVIEQEILNMENDFNNPQEAIKPKKRKQKKELNEKPGRGVDTLFRVTLSNHTRLSGIADSKANILLSVNAIIISIALSSLIQN